MDSSWMETLTKTRGARQTPPSSFRAEFCAATAGSGHERRDRIGQRIQLLDPFLELSWICCCCDLTTRMP